MSERTPYTNPPITEAIIAIGVKPNVDVDLAALQQLSRDSEDQYPIIEGLSQTTGSMQFSPTAGTKLEANQLNTGFRAWTEDKLDVCSRELANFSYTRLAPYSNWEPFCAAAKNLWASYRHATKPESITRAAVRFINRIDLPPSSVKMTRLEDYFSLYLELPSNLSEAMSGFFIQVQFPTQDERTKVVINHTIAPPKHSNGVSLILDIDLFCDEETPQSESDLWSYFKDLRKEKDRVFEACITDMTRSLFN